jgi:hypothetical protein
MCEFCKNISVGLPDWDFLPKDGENIVPSGIAIKITKIMNKNALVFTNSANEYGPGALDIQFCPMCGRKLVEE